MINFALFIRVKSHKFYPHILNNHRILLKFDKIPLHKEESIFIKDKILPNYNRIPINKDKIPYKSFKLLANNSKILLYN